MDYRGVLRLGVLGAAALLGSTSSCSAPDPWQVTFSERPRGQSTDLTGPAAPPPPPAPVADAAVVDTLTAFSGAGAFTAGAANGTSQNAAHPNGGNPAGVNCGDCHKAGGASGSIWGIAGTVYNSVAGTAVVPNAEVRLVDAAGKELAKVYSDALGNFWSDTIVGGLPGGSKVGVRNATVTKLMVTALTTQDSGCQKAGCHVVGAQGRVFLQ